VNSQKNKDQKLINHFLGIFFFQASVPHDDTITSILNVKSHVVPFRVTWQKLDGSASTVESL